MFVFPRSIALIAILVLGLCPATAVADEPPIITISGDIGQVNRGPSDVDDATMFGAHDLAFEKGYSLTREALGKLNQLTYVGKVPGKDDPVTFRGPLLTDVMALVATTGKTITVTALDGYGIEMPLSYLQAHKPILAIEVEGASLAIGDLVT